MHSRCNLNFTCPKCLSARRESSPWLTRPRSAHPNHPQTIPRRRRWAIGSHSSETLFCQRSRHRSNTNAGGPRWRARCARPSIASARGVCRRASIALHLWRRNAPNRIGTPLARRSRLCRPVMPTSLLRASVARRPLTHRCRFRRGRRAIACERIDLRSMRRRAGPRVGWNPFQNRHDGNAELGEEFRPHRGPKPVSCSVSADCRPGR